MRSLDRTVAWIALVVVGCWWLWQAAVLPLWNDEFVTLLQISGHMTVDGVAWPAEPLHAAALRGMMEGPTDAGALVSTLKGWDVHPPLYYLTAGYWSDSLGDGVGTVRALSVLCAWLSVVVVWWTARQIAGPAALLGLAALAVSPSMAVAAVNARGYGMGVLCVAIAVCAAVQATRRPSAFGWPLLAFGAGATGLWVHYFTVLFTAPALVVLIIATGRQQWRAHGVGMAGGLVALWAIWPALQGQMGARPDQFSGFLGLGPESLLLSRVAVSQWSSLPSAWPWLWPVVLLVGVVWMGVLVAVGLVRRPRDAGAWVMGASAFGGLLALLALFWWTDKSLASFDAPRYGLFALPGLALLASVVGARLGRACPRPGVLAAGMVATVAFGGLSWVSPDRVGLPWSSQGEVRAAERLFLEVAGDDPAAGVVLFASRDVGFIGARIPLLPEGVEVRLVQGEPVLGHMDGAERLLVLSYRDTGFDAAQRAALRSAAQEVGFDTSTDVWHKKDAEQ